MPVPYLKVKTLNPEQRRVIEEFVGWYTNNYRGRLSDQFRALRQQGKLSNRQLIYMAEDIFSHYVVFRALVSRTNDWKSFFPVRDRESSIRQYLQDGLENGLLPEGDYNARCCNQDLLVEDLAFKIRMLQDYTRMPKAVAKHVVMPMLGKRFRPKPDAVNIILVPSRERRCMYCFSQEQMRKQKRLRQNLRFRNPYTMQPWNEEERRAIEFQLKFKDLDLKITRAFRPKRRRTTTNSPKRKRRKL